MDVHGLSREVASMLRENNIRKIGKVTRNVLHVSDDEGNHTDFVVKIQDPSMPFHVEDVETILKYAIKAIENTLQRGECVNARGFGKLEVKYREPRRTRDIETGEWIDVSGRYIPKFTFGTDLRAVARLYERSLEELNYTTRADLELSEEEFDE